MKKIYLNVKKGGAGNVSNRRANLLSSVDHVDPKSVNSIPPYIIPIHPRNENLPLVVVHE